MHSIPAVIAFKDAQGRVVRTNAADEHPFADAPQAAEALEEQAGHFANVTYTHPNEDGSVSQDLDPATIAAKFGHVGSNDPCPCGSGKKYKQCHGR